MFRSVVLILASTLLAVPAWAQPETPPACEDVPGFHALDFWVGSWDVFSGKDKAGTNRIEKILNGCAIMEHWTASTGGEGKSLFYYHAQSDRWKQVWVTERATAVGALKEKVLIERFDDGGVRFQGEIPLADGGLYYDRTTLTPLPDGRVRQLIEMSRDGENWEATFDAHYERTD